MPQFQVKRNQFSAGRIIETPSQSETELADGEVLVKVDHFAYTANNITYAVAGDRIGYWQFFPPHNANAEEWGVIPVWGFADVVSSNNAEIQEGERLFGYFPPATHLTLLPTHTSADKFVDGSAHRSQLPAGYNIYRRVKNEGNYNPAKDNQRMMLWPLHLTAYCLWDALQYNNWYGAEQVIILSASSKTSIGLAIALEEDENAPAIVGLTSSRNKAKVEALGIYDQVFVYDELSEIDHGKKAVIVDMSGNMTAVNSLNDSMGESLVYCIQVGITHWEQAAQRIQVDKEKREFFFAPGHIQKRMKELGFEKIEKDSSEFIGRSGAKIENWLSYQTVDGLEGLAAIHEDVCMGKIEADIGLIVQL